MVWHEGWEAVFFSYDDQELFFEPVFCWALVSERPYVENGEGEKTYIEGQVMIGNGDIVFMDYHNTWLPEMCRREQMGHLKRAAEELMELRRSGHLPTIERDVQKVRKYREYSSTHNQPGLPLKPWLVDLGSGYRLIAIS